jgi:hypothetical protein
MIKPCTEQVAIFNAPLRPELSAEVYFLIDSKPPF